MFKPEEKIAMFKVILSAEAQGNERMEIADVMKEEYTDFVKHRVAAEMCNQLLKILSDEDLLERRYVIAQGIHQHIGQEGALMKHLIEIINHPDFFDDEREGKEDV